ncbi:uncharacterized protein LOC101851256 isoform X2 [Aplysia californica]|uniref:Uncharacterized protein LOC101851256 isoform X2 n=1 Tax=Aplysia californica TaxID=6500 RepID=A0ABM0JJC1_APLCA|nr:uncharacterized protein LOC101851256 isoform X2 [Aplysia californica]
MAALRTKSLFVVIIPFFIGLIWGAAANSSRCPDDFRYRAETCVMEAQVAPQAGGGLPLITERNKLEELCERGILHKAIDCLRDVYNRCQDNTTVKAELDMLYSVPDWQAGQALLCQDLNLFKDHFDCVSKFGPRISTCILIRTQMFRKAITDAGIAPSRTLHDITCNFAENIVNCLERPLARACPVHVVDTMVTALHRFLPPACAPVPAVRKLSDGNGDAHAEREAFVFETVIVEGGEGEN